MANGKIKINTDIANEVLSNLTSASTSLESDVSCKLASDFQALSDIGFASNSLSKIQEQVTELINTEKEIVSTISSHINKVGDEEASLRDGYVYSGGKANASSQDTAVAASESEIALSDTGDSKSLNFTKVENTIAALDDENLLKLISFFNVYKNSDDSSSSSEGSFGELKSALGNIKGDDTSSVDEDAAVTEKIYENLKSIKGEGISLTSLLLDDENSELLYTLLKKAVSGSVELGELTADEMKEVQKLVLDKILTSNVKCPELKTDSILMAKKYLVKICNKYNIKPSELFFDDKYKSLLKKTLVKIYNGKTKKTLSKKVVNNFRDYIDKVAEDNNLKAYDLIANHLDLLI